MGRIRALRGIGKNKKFFQIFIFSGFQMEILTRETPYGTMRNKVSDRNH